MKIPPAKLQPGGALVAPHGGSVKARTWAHVQQRKASHVRQLAKQMYDDLAASRMP